MAPKTGPIKLSTRWLGPLRWVLFAVYIGLFGTIAQSFLRTDLFFGLLQTGIYGYLFWQLIGMTQKLEMVSFDEDFLYVVRKEQEVMVPLENIRSVEISTLGGVYKVTVFHAEQLGKEFFFKPSLLYPINFKSKDRLVNQLRSNIEKAKRKPPAYQANALAS